MKNSPFGASPARASTGVWTNQDPSPPSPLLGLSGVGREEIARIEKRIAEIDTYVATYPSQHGGTTWQHAQDLKVILALQGVSSSSAHPARKGPSALPETISLPVGEE